MILISDNLLVKYIDANKKFKLDKFINEKLFTVSDTPLTYRQVNSLDANQLLTNDRNEKQGWRKFSFKELVYILIVHELKKFGLKHKQLKELWEAFFKEHSRGIHGVNKCVGEIAIGCVFGQVEMTLRVSSEGRIMIYDPTHLLLFPNIGRAEITMDLNTTVNSLLKKMGKEPIPIRWSVANEVLDSATISTKENEVLKIIRNSLYSAITIKKKDGESYTVYAERINSNNSDTKVEDLIKMLKAKDFQDINIVQRNGKIVNYKIEETIKL